MATTTMNGAARTLLKQLARTQGSHTALNQTVRGFHASRPALGGYGNEPAYIHAKHMYDIQGMSSRKLKFGTAIAGMVCFGFGIPIWACSFSQKKLEG